MVIFFLFNLQEQSSDMMGNLGRLEEFLQFYNLHAIEIKTWVNVESDLKRIG